MTAGRIIEELAKLLDDKLLWLFYDEKMFLVRCNFFGLDSYWKLNYDPDVIQILSLNKFCNSLFKFVLV